MIEPTQEFIKKAVENHFDVSEVDIGLVKMQFYFEDQDFKEKINLKLTLLVPLVLFLKIVFVSITLKLLQESYNNLLMLYNSIVDDEDKNNLIQSKSLEQHNYIEEYKEFMKIFRESQENRYLNDAVNVYKTKIVEVNKILMELKYKVISVEMDEEITTLIQKKYYPNDLEILIKK